MSSDPQSLLQRSRHAAEAQIRLSVRQRYFPEIWYAIEHWFQQLRGRRVLEAGYGLGLIAEAMAKSGWDVTLVDASLTALTELRGRFDTAQLSAAFEQADPDKLPFAGASFDAVASINTLEFAGDAAEAVREIHRVLVPGGRAVIATFNKLSPWGIASVAQAIREGDDRRLSRFLTKGAFQKLLTQAGLAIEDIKDRACYLPVGGAMKVRLPVAGAYVALVAKPGARSGGDKDKAQKPRPTILGR